MSNERITEHVNSQGERITIERPTSGPFIGDLILVIYDDPPLCTPAPMLLDDGTMEWLSRSLADLRREEPTDE